MAVSGISEWYLADVYRTSELGLVFTITIAGAGIGDIVIDCY